MTKEAEAMGIVLSAFSTLFDKMTPEESLNFKRGLFEGICEYFGIKFKGGYDATTHVRDVASKLKSG